MSGNDNGGGTGGNKGADDFEARLRARMRAATENLTPIRGLDEIGTGHPGVDARNTWARAGAITMVAAALVVAIVWVARPSSTDPLLGANTANTTLSSPPATTVPGADAALDTAATVPAPAVPQPTFPVADPSARNFLVVGADNNACVDPDSIYVDAFGDRSTMGERSDTIMIVRLDPSTGRAAMLSVPRDLWVPIAGGNGKGRINSAYRRDSPGLLIDTIYQNFGIAIDHFVQVDFCAFKTIVDAVGGVSVPFDRPARDEHTGLNVPTTGCFTFDGDHALAYVRSRHFEVLNTDGTWRTDPAGDLSRIARQQAFTRLLMAEVVAGGLTDVGTARSLISTVQNYVVIDSQLTISTMLEYFGVLVGIDPTALFGYTVESTSAMVSGNSVQIPILDSPSMLAVVDVFAGRAPLPEAPIEQPFFSPIAATATAHVEAPAVPPIDMTC